MCRGKVKNGGRRIELERKTGGLRSELGELEREYAGLWSELAGSSSVKMQVSGTDGRTRLAGIQAGR